MDTRPTICGSDLPRHWLLLRLSALGDVVLTTGVMAYWAQRFGWRFSVLTKEAFAPVLQGHPAVAEVYALRDDALRPARLFPWFRRLASEHADWGLLDAHGVLRTRLLGLLWKGPRRRYTGLALSRRVFLASGGQFGRQALRAATVTQRYALAVEDRVPLPAELAPRIYLSEEERAGGLARVRAVAGQTSPVIALHPYAAHACKAWPRDHWISLARKLDAAGIPWLAVGKGRPLFPASPRDMTNDTGLRQSCAVLASCALLVTGDSGPMHLASAVGTPVLALFGPTVREWGFFPAGARDQVLELDLPCRPCSLHGSGLCAAGGECMRRLTPDDVLERILRATCPSA